MDRRNGLKLLLLEKQSRQALERVIFLEKTKMEMDI
jgi:hypothetical protein